MKHWNTNITNGISYFIVIGVCIQVAQYNVALYLAYCVVRLLNGE